MIFSLSLISKNTLPPVAWKKLPWGKWSKTVAPLWIIAAPDIGEIPSPKIVLPNTELATAVPAVVEAVAPDISIPAAGASKNAGKPKPCRPLIITSFSPELATMPAIVPVPISRIATLLIFANPVSEYLLRYLSLPIAKAPTAPPIGRAIKGSMVMLKTGLRASSRIAASGPTIEAKKLGFSSAEIEISSSAT